MEKITIIDTKVTNLASVCGALDYLGASYKITESYNDILESKRLILPGVGNFGSAVDSIDTLNYRHVILKRVLKDKIPILGICLGMQLLGCASEESEGSKGLGLVNATCTRLKLSRGIKIPHVGFNQVEASNDDILFKDIGPNPDFYFTHSFAFYDVPNSLKYTCKHGESFVAAFQMDHIFGTQFHPEKSQSNGLILLKNFMEFMPNV